MRLGAITSRCVGLLIDAARKKWAANIKAANIQANWSMSADACFCEATSVQFQVASSSAMTPCLAVMAATVLISGTSLPTVAAPDSANI